MATRARFFDSVGGDRQYTAGDFSQVFDPLAPDKVINAYADGLAVIASTPAAMTVKVSTGAAFVNGRFFEVYDAPETLAIAAAHATMQRYDLVVIRVNYTARTASLAVVTGTPASFSAPVPVPTQSSSIYEIPLARVFVAPAASSIATTNISDMRSALTGPGSGWDADTLDGQHSSYFARAIAYGVVSSAGSLLYSGGVTSVTKTGTGLYRITVQGLYYAIVATVQSQYFLATGYRSSYNGAESIFNIQIYNGATSNVDATFSFIIA